jgi:hypothetical protein
VPQSLDPRAANARTVARTSLYLGATLDCGGTQQAVRIRNISSVGALIEGAAIPPVGTLVRIIRGDLTVEGITVWAAERRCGVKFWGHIDVTAWRAAPPNGEQQRIDKAVQLVKAGVVPLPGPTAAAQSVQSNDQLAGDLGRAAELLAGLGETLAEDDAIVASHGAMLQNLDIATQVIAAVQAILGGPDPRDAGAERLAALRRSADQALLARR